MQGKYIKMQKNKTQETTLVIHEKIIFNYKHWRTQKIQSHQLHRSKN